MRSRLFSRSLKTKPSTKSLVEPSSSFGSKFVKKPGTFSDSQGYLGSGREDYLELGELSDRVEYSGNNTRHEAVEGL